MGVWGPKTEFGDFIHKTCENTFLVISQLKILIWQWWRACWKRISELNIGKSKKIKISKFGCLGPKKPSFPYLGKTGEYCPRPPKFGKIPNFSHMSKVYQSNVSKKSSTILRIYSKLKLWSIKCFWTKSIGTQSPQKIKYQIGENFSKIAYFLLPGVSKMRKILQCIQFVGVKQRYFDSIHIYLAQKPDLSYVEKIFSNL